MHHARLWDSGPPPLSSAPLSKVAHSLTCSFCSLAHPSTSLRSPSRVAPLAVAADCQDSFPSVNLVANLRDVSAESFIVDVLDINKYWLSGGYNIDCYWSVRVHWVATSVDGGFDLVRAGVAAIQVPPGNIHDSHSVTVHVDVSPPWPPYWGYSQSRLQGQMWVLLTVENDVNIVPHVATVAATHMVPAATASAAGSTVNLTSSFTAIVRLISNNPKRAHIHTERPSLPPGGSGGTPATAMNFPRLHWIAFLKPAEVADGGGVRVNYLTRWLHTGAIQAMMLNSDNEVYWQLMGKGRGDTAGRLTMQGGEVAGHDSQGRPLQWWTLYVRRTTLRILSLTNVDSGNTGSSKGSSNGNGNGNGGLGGGVGAGAGAGAAGDAGESLDTTDPYEPCQQEYIAYSIPSPGVWLLNATKLYDGSAVVRGKGKGKGPGDPKTETIPCSTLQARSEAKSKLSQPAAPPARGADEQCAGTPPCSGHGTCVQVPWSPGTATTPSYCDCVGSYSGDACLGWDGLKISFSSMTVQQKVTVANAAALSSSSAAASPAPLSSSSLSSLSSASSAGSGSNDIDGVETLGSNTVDASCNYDACSVDSDISFERRNIIRFSTIVCGVHAGDGAEGAHTMGKDTAVIATLGANFPADMGGDGFSQQEQMVPARLLTVATVADSRAARKNKEVEVSVEMHCLKFVKEHQFAGNCPVGRGHVCSGHGVCHFANMSNSRGAPGGGGGGNATGNASMVAMECRCMDNFMGVACGDCKPSFFGTLCRPCPGNVWNPRTNQTMPCSGHGVCNNATGHCSCDPGFESSTPDMPSVESNCGSCSRCNGHGMCVQGETKTGDDTPTKTTAPEGRCKCDEAWVGEWCNASCGSGFGGASCARCPTCVHGACSEGFGGTGKCVCEKNFDGTLCDLATPEISGNTGTPAGGYPWYTYFFVILVVLSLGFWAIQTGRGCRRAYTKRQLRRQGMEMLYTELEGHDSLEGKLGSGSGERSWSGDEGGGESMIQSFSRQRKDFIIARTSLALGKIVGRGASAQVFAATYHGTKWSPTLYLLCVCVCMSR